MFVMKFYLQFKIHFKNGKLFSKINLKNCKTIDGLYLVEMYKKQIVYDKPISVGTSILDLSKLCMMEFHYGVIDK